MRNILVVVVIVLCIFPNSIFSKNQDLWTLQSPDKQISIKVIESKGSIFYSLFLNKKQTVQRSALGVALENNSTRFIDGLKILSASTKVIDETYTLKTGKRAICRNFANELTLKIQNKSGETAFIVFRAYNDGVAFRYKLQNKNKELLQNEQSEFAFTQRSEVWAMDYRPDFEGFYKHQLLDTLTNNQGKGPNDYPFFAMPVLVKNQNNNWMLIHEAAVLGNSAASSLQKNKNNSFSVFTHYPKFKPIDENNLLGYEKYNLNESSNIVVNDHFVSPWRVIIIGNSLKTIVESTLIENLNPAPSADYSWVSSGVCSFPWWGNNFANGDSIALKQYIDFTAEMNWKYVEFDVSLVGSPFFAVDIWKTTPWVKSIVDYARSKGVLVYGWDERRNLDTPEKRADIFGRYKSLGIKGIKIDFINSIKQEAMEFREACLKDAAIYQLNVSFHGDYSPRGERRTYPNLITNEGIKGAEYYLFDKENMPNAIHNTTIPFTRNVVGAMDYTPCALSAKSRTTTYSHELALPVLFESGWTAMCDKPEVYRASPAYEYLKKLESTWDETVFIDGYPGEYFCLARRKGNKWFIAGNNATKERTITLGFPFLKTANIETTLYYDGDNAQNICSTKKITVGKDKKATISMAANGGFAMCIEE